MQVILRVDEELSDERLATLLSELGEEIKRRALIADDGMLDSILRIVRPAEDDEAGADR